MSHSINWDLLEDQYLSDGVYREKLSKMVTIVDEAFLAGKKFAQTYSQNMDNGNSNTDAKKNAIIDSFNSDMLKNVDITYKEIKGAKRDDVNISNNNIVKPEVPVDESKSSDVSEENLKDDLKKLLEDNKITKVLYDKLASNKNFELTPKDIEDINKLTDGRIKLLLLKSKGLFCYFCLFSNLTIVLLAAKQINKISMILFNSIVFALRFS